MLPKVHLAIPLLWLTVLAPQVLIYALNCHWAHILGWLESEFSYGTPPAVCFTPSFPSSYTFMHSVIPIINYISHGILNVSVFLTDPYMDAKILIKPELISLWSLFSCSSYQHRHLISLFLNHREPEAYFSQQTSRSDTYSFWVKDSRGLAYSALALLEHWYHQVKKYKSGSLRII